MTAIPKRVFDPMLPLMGQYRPIPDTEDKDLTTWLQSHLDDILSLSEEPPRCPHCGGGETVLKARAAHPKPIIPVFTCLICDIHFRRTTGTPLSGLKFRKLSQFVRLLSQQRPITDAAGILEVKAVTVIRWVKRMRQWILELDPSGYWEAKVRLGMEIRPVVNCPRCGSADTMHYRGFASDTGERKCRCDNCGRYCRLSEVLREGGAISAIEHGVVRRPPSSRRKLQAQ